MRRWHLLLILWFLPGVFVHLRAQNAATDRMPAVAGQFYPSDAAQLRRELAELFANAGPSKGLTGVAALISPHAGYSYSGVVAASAYNQIDPSAEYDNVFIIGPSHYVGFEGAAVYAEGSYSTPLGKVRVNSSVAGELIRAHRFFTDRTDAHAREHSVEVQIPFLQYRLKKMPPIVPIVLGSNPPDLCRKIADALRPYFTPKNLFVISTDFSHYPRAEDAASVDEASAEAVCVNSSERLLNVLAANDAKRVPNLVTSMCGEVCVLTLLDLTEHDPRMKFTRILYRNSGDVAEGSRDRVVGYHAIAVTRIPQEPRGSFELGPTDRRTLLRIARSTLEAYVRDRHVPPVDTASLPPILRTPCGAFVTLYVQGNLRGCIGRFDPGEPLYKVIQDMAVASATQDPRFSPVTADETARITIEISVLTPLRRIRSADEFILGKHGIYMRNGARSGTFLPQVAAETGWSKEEFLGHCARDKAGLDWDGWRTAELYVYEAIVFGEAGMKGH